MAYGFRFAREKLAVAGLRAGFADIPTFAIPDNKIALQAFFDSLDIFLNLPVRFSR